MLGKCKGLIGFLWLCVASHGLAASQQGKELVGLHTDIAMSELGGELLTINLAFPPQNSGKPRPVVVLVHGGGFVKGDKNSKNSQIQKLAKHGFVAASAMYRLAPQYKFPIPLEDIKLAIRFLKANAKLFNLNPDRIIVSGSSAGSYLAVMVGVTGNSNAFSDHDQYANYDSSVRAVAAQSAPIADFSLQKYRDSLTVKRLADTTLGDLVYTLRAMSPNTYLDPEDPPFFLSHGDSDPIVPVDMSREFVTELEKINHSFRYFEVKGGTHSFSQSAPKQAKLVFSEYLNFIQHWSE